MESCIFFVWYFFKKSNKQGNYMVVSSSQNIYKIRLLGEGTLKIPSEKQLLGLHFCKKLLVFNNVFKNLIQF